jgi:hypothetical protein
MFLRRKRRNRRLDHDFVLEVKARPGQTDAGRWRLSLGIFAAALFALSLLFGVWRGGQWMMDRLIYSNSAFAIQQIEVRTDGALAPDQLRRWIQARPGDNLLALDMARVKRDLEMVPYIESASVERILPHTLKARVFEREPVAQALALEMNGSGALIQRVCQIDETGHVMAPLDPRWRSSPPLFPPDQLPILSGLNVSDLVSGRKLDSPAVQAALSFISQFNRSAMAALVDLQWIDVSRSDLLEVRTRQESEITFAPEGFEIQLRRWQQIFELYARSNKIVTSLDLSISNNIPLRWAEASGIPPALPKPVKTARNRRKNV